MAEQEFNVKVMGYFVSLLPDDHRNWGSLRTAVRPYGPDSWAVGTYHEFYAGPTGDSDYMPAPAATHLYPLEEAMRVARIAAERMTWDGKTAADILAMEEESRA